MAVPDYNQLIENRLQTTEDNITALAAHQSASDLVSQSNHHTTWFCVVVVAILLLGMGGIGYLLGRHDIKLANLATKSESQVATNEQVWRLTENIYKLENEVGVLKRSLRRQGIAIGTTTGEPPLAGEEKK